MLCLMLPPLPKPEGDHEEAALDDVYDRSDNCEGMLCHVPTLPPRFAIRSKQKKGVN